MRLFGHLTRHQSFALGLCVAAALAAPACGALAGEASPESPAPFSSASTPAVSSSKGPIDAVRGWFSGGSGQADLLPADEAYKLDIRVKDANSLIATLTPADGYYLYRDRIKFVVEDPPGVTVSDVSLPRGDFKEDPNFGKTEVYHRPVEAVVRLAHGAVRPSSIRLRATYQGCNEPLGVCYPPIDKTVTVALDASPRVPGDSSATPVASIANGSLAPGSGELDASDTGRIRRLFSQGANWTLLAAFFGFGVLLAFTPCMLPMIPILSGIIVGQSARRTRRRAVALSAAYVFGMAITYAAAGVAAGLAGAMLSSALQNAWVLGAFAAIFVLLALSMFGVYELQLPASLQTRLADVSRRLPGGHGSAVFLMGAVSAVIVGPCVAAPLAGALLYISQTHDGLLGGAALFSMAIGMGIPLLVVGATAGTLLQRAGPCTESIKRFFGVTMLALAIYVVSPVTPIVAQQLLWAALLIVSAMFVRAIDPLPPEAAGGRRFLKGVGVIGLVAGVALLVGALSDSHDLLRPLAGMRGAAMRASAEMPFQPVKTVADLDGRLASARGRYVMLDFWAEWCVSCKEMDRFTFSDARVQARLKNAVVLRADVTANSKEDQALLRRFSLFGPPGIVFFDPQGREVPYRVIGYESAEKFLASLERVMALPRTEVIGER